MGIPLEMRDMWVNNRRRRDALLIPSPLEDEIQHKALRAKTCTRDGARQGFNFQGSLHLGCCQRCAHTSIAAYFITADKTILECARKNAQLQQALSRQK